MTRKHDAQEAASDAEALQAIKAGLTALRVSEAILTSRQAQIAGAHGFERNAIARLALRWGILGNEKD